MALPVAVGMHRLTAWVLITAACTPTSPAEGPSPPAAPGPGASAEAQQPAPATVEPPASDCGDDVEARARALFEEGRRAFRLGNYDVAADAFQDAHGCMPKAALLYDVAKAREAAGRLEEALDLYEKLALDPTADDEMQRAALENIDILSSQLR